MVEPINEPLRSHIGRYQIKDLVGRGGMGEVYRAFDPDLDRVVALKTIITGGNNTALVERLLREARTYGRLHHQGIVTVYDVGQAEGSVFIAMEFVEGSNLDEILRRGPLSTDGVFSILTQILDALDYAHGQGVIHRDIKPGNVLQMKTGDIKILDFGIARVADLEPLTMTGEIVGTPHYMSPEQLRAQPVDGRTDIYSTGVVAYELFTGRRAFDGASVTAVIEKVLRESAAPMDTPFSATCPEIEAIVQRAMAKSPEDRFGHAREMADALRCVFDRERHVILQAKSQDTIVPSITPEDRFPQAAAVPALVDETLVAFPASATEMEGQPRGMAADAPTVVYPESGLAQSPPPVHRLSVSGVRRARWPLAIAACAVIGMIVYLAPRFQSANEADARPAEPGGGATPSTAASMKGAGERSTGVAAGRPASDAKSGGQPETESGPTPEGMRAPIFLGSGARPARPSPAQTFDAHAVSVAAVSDRALSAALKMALRDRHVGGQATEPRWILTVRDEISVRASGLGEGALTADYAGSLDVQDRTTGAIDRRHFEGHAMEFGESLARAAAVEALAGQIADAVALIVK